MQVIGQVRPTAFFGVPRVWEKIRAGIQALLAAEQDEGKRAAAARATLSVRAPFRAPDASAVVMRKEPQLMPHL